VKRLPVALLVGLGALSAFGLWACFRSRAKAPARAAVPVASAAPAAEPDTRPRNIRQPSAAGTFYPADADELASAVRQALAAAPRENGAPVRIVLAPHAGIRFSGGVAAHSIKQLEPGFSRVVILAANHNDEADWDGVSVDQVTDYAMPGFVVHVAPLVTRLVKHPGFVIEPRAHVMHMVEMELPFLRAVGGDGFQIVPLIVGRLHAGDPARIAALLVKLADEKTRFVFSVDLSHFHPYDDARARDLACLQALVSTEADAIAKCDTDGTRVLSIMNELAAKLALTPRLIRYQNSGDVSGERDSVVGYGALVYEDRFELGQAEGRALSRLARAALTMRVRDGLSPAAPKELERRFPRLGAKRSAFVTLEKRGVLRGCIGSLEPSEPLADNVVRNAQSAALEDSRFSPVEKNELAELTVSVSVLDVPRPLAALAPEALLARLGKEKPGVILGYQGRRSTFLPQVWEEIPGPRKFLQALCEKQGSDQSCWQNRAARYETYSAQVFEEER
jgi:MEMO1 family protein